MPLQTEAAPATAARGGRGWLRLKALECGEGLDPCTCARSSSSLRDKVTSSRTAPSGIGDAVASLARACHCLRRISLSLAIRMDEKPLWSAFCFEMSGW